MLLVHQLHSAYTCCFMFRDCSQSMNPTLDCSCSSSPVHANALMRTPTCGALAVWGKDYLLLTRQVWLQIGSPSRNLCTSLLAHTSACLPAHPLSLLPPARPPTRQRSVCLLCAVRSARTPTQSSRQPLPLRLRATRPAVPFVYCHSRHPIFKGRHALIPGASSHSPSIHNPSSIHAPPSQQGYFANMTRVHSVSRVFSWTLALDFLNFHILHTH